MIEEKLEETVITDAPADAAPQTEDLVLKSVVENLGFFTTKDVLVKPLEPIMVEKDVAVGTGEMDEIDGYEKMTTEKQTVESDFEEGLVLGLPSDMETESWKFTIGSKVLYSKKFAKAFDVFKDSRLVKPYDIVAIRK